MGCATPCNAASIMKVFFVHFFFVNAKAAVVDEVFYADLFYFNQCLLQFLFKLKFCV